VTSNPSLALPTILGVCNSQSIVAQTTPTSFMSTQSVTLNFSYARNPPPGYPVPNAGSAVPSIYASPQTILSGTRITVFSDEAAALLLAGVASS
jgi:hypothetical protein